VTQGRDRQGLASDEASYRTGRTLGVTGGVVMR
jgi:hypothetical protein